ncbi:sulfite reductase [Parachlamydia sp. AcF125]|uniref:sulfite reductase n=1 Tax=Parachlamydia sp. AcF125 TaxID=2795736 RepID=UPI001BC96E9A|nr:sulfite reductase [Parachlamydia sp. AcF125]MBS4167893.1 Sulfite reductase [NADPH] flavoprotein alpha-component [Parachlamydia sp. AcF125]
MSAPSKIYDRKNPFLASIKERYSLCNPGSKKNTYHLVLDLKDSGISYAVGDSVAIFPQHDPELVDRTLKILNASGNEVIVDKRSQETLPLHAFLTTKVAITTVSRKLYTETAARQLQADKKAQLSYLLQSENQPLLKAYLEKHGLWEFLAEHSEVKWNLQELCDSLMPLLPRFYSIASSMKAVGNEMHLTVALPHALAETEVKRGVCTHYLCHLAPLNEPVIPLYIQAHHGFTLPENIHAPMIMIGPGTGIAPFRAFMQERTALKAPGKNWLFFGEWHRAHNFFYEGYWKELEAQGHLRLDAAFSRDQEQKIYVQHLLHEKGEEVFEWLQNGASLFVCGDAHRMAKDVEKTLKHIVSTHGNLDEPETEKYFKTLKSEKRYLRDVY